MAIKLGLLDNNLEKVSHFLRKIKAPGRSMKRCFYFLFQISDVRPGMRIIQQRMLGVCSVAEITAGCCVASFVQGERPSGMPKGLGCWGVKNN